MRLLDYMPRSLLWRPGGFVPSLTHPDLSRHATARWEVALDSNGQGLAGQPLVVVELTGGKVVADLRLVATRDDVVIGGVQSLCSCADPENHYALQRRRLRLPQFRRGTALLLGLSNADNYYHWILESLPRWQILQAAGHLDYDFVLLPERPVRFQDDTLDRLGVPREKRLRGSKNFVHQFERLIVPSMAFPAEAVAPWACAWVGSVLREPGGGPEKLYLSRRGAPRRRLVNEGALETALKAHGFTIVQAGRLTVAEQARVFSSARWVVAPHGAALTNMIFAPPGAVLVELFHPQYQHQYYFNLAKACGHNYACLAGLPVNDPADPDLAYRVDVSTVLRLSGVPTA